MATNTPTGSAWSHRRAGILARPVALAVGCWLFVAVNPSIADSTLATGSGPLGVSAHVNFRIVIPRSLQLDVRQVASADEPLLLGSPTPSPDPATARALVAHVFTNAGSVVATSSSRAFNDEDGATPAATMLPATRSVVRQTARWVSGSQTRADSADHPAGPVIYTIQSP